MRFLPTWPAHFLQMLYQAEGHDTLYLFQPNDFFVLSHFHVVRLFFYQDQMLQEYINRFHDESIT